MKRLLVALVIIALAWAATPDAQKRPAAPKTPRLYIFDNGDISGLDPKIFGFTREQLKSVDFVNQSYLVVHPRGVVMFDTGGIGDDKFPAGGGMAKEGIMTASKKLVPQMEAAGYKPSDVTYLVLSHYHSDHTGNANLFAGATWIVQKAEHDVMFAEKPLPIMQQATYSALKTAKTKILNNEDLDVFGDGTIVVKSTPGHTPGHQSLLITFEERPPLVLLGDAAYSLEKMRQRRLPAIVWSPDAIVESWERIERIERDTGAELRCTHEADYSGVPISPSAWWS